MHLCRASRGSIALVSTYSEIAVGTSTTRESIADLMGEILLPWGTQIGADRLFLLEFDRHDGG